MVYLKNFFNRKNKEEIKWKRKKRKEERLLERKEKRVTEWRITRRVSDPLPLLLLHVCLPSSFKTPLSLISQYISIYFSLSLSVSFDQRDFEEWIRKEFGLVWLFRGVLYRYEWLYINSCDSTLFFFWVSFDLFCF